MKRTSWTSAGDLNKCTRLKYSRFHSCRIRYVLSLDLIYLATAAKKSTPRNMLILAIAILLEGIQLPPGAIATILTKRATLYLPQAINSSYPIDIKVIFMESMTRTPLICRRDYWEPLYKTKYPRSSAIKPHHGLSFQTTLFQANPPEMAFVDWRIPHSHWHTTSGLAHGNKIPDRFTSEIICKAPSSQVMHRMFPNVENHMKTTSQRLLYGPNPVYNTITKTDYVPKRAICDFDYQNGPLVNIPKRYIRVSRKTMSKPKFDLDVMHSVVRKFHPYLSVTTTDYRNPTMDKDKYGSGYCAI